MWQNVNIITTITNFSNDINLTDRKLQQVYRHDTWEILADSAKNQYTSLAQASPESRRGG